MVNIGYGIDYIIYGSDSQTQVCWQKRGHVQQVAIYSKFKANVVASYNIAMPHEDVDLL